MLPSCYFAFTISSCGAKSRLRMSKESRMAVLLVNCTFTCFMSFAPFALASTAVAAPSALIVRWNEPMSPSRTVLPFSKASITSYCKASNTAFTSALYPLYDLRQRYRRGRCSLRIKLHFFFLQRILLRLNYLLYHIA